MCGAAGGQGKGLFRVKSTGVSHPWRWYPDSPHWWRTLFRSHGRRRICWYLPLSFLCLQSKLPCQSLKYILSCCLDSKPFCMSNLYAWDQFQIPVCFLLVYHDDDHIPKALEWSLKHLRLNLHSRRHCGGSVSEGGGFAPTSRGLCNRHGCLKLNNEESATGGVIWLYRCLRLF